MNMPVFKYGAMVPISSQLLEELSIASTDLDAMLYDALEASRYDLEQHELDHRFGPRFGPPRSIHHAWQRDQHHADRGRRLLRSLPGTPGAVRRPLRRQP